jgi:hypothetical protein
VKEKIKAFWMAAGSALSFIFAIAIIYMAITCIPAPLAPLKVWMPEKANFEKEKDFHPGTGAFFDRTVTQIKILAENNPGQLTVVYPDQPIESDKDENKQGITYRLPRGDGTFYVAVQNVPFNSHFFFKWQADFHKENGTFTYTSYRNREKTICVILFFIISGMLLAASSRKKWEEFKKSLTQE